MMVIFKVESNNLLCVKASVSPITDGHCNRFQKVFSTIHED
jgi:hypothetical protein